MKDARRLKDRIAKLGAKTGEFDARGRNILSRDDTDGVASVLREIDETILPRKLSFETDSGVVTVVASNRRLTSIEAVLGEDLAHVSGVVGLSLTRPDVADLGRLRDSLVAAFGKATAIFVKSEGLRGDSPNFADGTTAAALGSAWGIDFGSPEPGQASQIDPIATFLGAMSGVSYAWVQIEAGKQKEHSGPAELIAKLRDFADSADMAELDVQTGQSGGRLIAIGRAPDDGDALIIATYKADLSLMLLPAGAIEDAYYRWYQALS